MNRSKIINFSISLYGYESYLEIGVRKLIVNFNKVVCKLKHGIDPNPRAKATYVMTSNSFFKGLDKAIKYDLIFIDGMHTEESAYEDVLNSLDHLSDNGTIVMHDCNPVDEHRQRSYEKYRRSGGHWNGTVWRAFVKLRVRRPDLAMYTVNTDEGVGIIRIGTQAVLSCDLNSLDYNMFAKNRVNMLKLVKVDTFKKMEVSRRDSQAT